MLLRRCVVLLLTDLLAAGLLAPPSAQASVSFLSPVAYPKVSAGFLRAIDWDGDGNDDLAVASFDGGDAGTVSVFYGRGDGTFEPPVDYVLGNDLMEVSAGDLNGDGVNDLVFTAPYATVFEVDGVHRQHGAILVMAK